jgi:predicted HicB family RNase H-like nuclease
MSQSLTYKTYKAAVSFDAEDEVFVGRILGINDVVSFHAETVVDLKRAFEDAVDDYIETCRKIGKTPEKAYSGKVMLRIDPDVHSLAAQAAESEGKSLNQWSEEALRQAARGAR